MALMFRLRDLSSLLSASSSALELLAINELLESCRFKLDRARDGVGSSDRTSKDDDCWLCRRIGRANAAALMAVIRDSKYQTKLHIADSMVSLF
jgi:hypothetical protein